MEQVNRFYENGEVVIDLEEVGHVTIASESSCCSHQVIMKYSTYNTEADCYNNDYWLRRDSGDGAKFVEAWKRYKSQK
jgi:hypothetical protein